MLELRAMNLRCVESLGPERMTIPLTCCEWVAAKSRTIEEISYPQYLFVFPMFLFCGVFFPLSSLPVYLQWFARLLPLTPIVSLLRALTLGAAFSVWDGPVVLAWLAVAAPLARRAMSQRLIK